MNEHNEFINEFYPDNQVIKEWSKSFQFYMIRKWREKEWEQGKRI
jgi:deoxyadenosine/deoxycytidine kinase